MHSLQYGMLNHMKEPSHWSDCYPPDFDHGGLPLLGDDPAAWTHLFEDVVFLGAECALDGRIVVVVATVRAGFVEVEGQHVHPGQPLRVSIAHSIRDSVVKIPIDRGASRLLGLDIELNEVEQTVDWETAADRIEIDLLSTISRAVDSGCLPRNH